MALDEPARAGLLMSCVDAGLFLPMRVSTLVARAGIVLSAGVAIVLTALDGCALGTEQEPGCHADAECADGGICRAGACFWATTGLTNPGDAGDA